MKRLGLANEREAVERAARGPLGAWPTTRAEARALVDAVAAEATDNDLQYQVAPPRWPHNVVVALAILASTDERGA